MNAMRKWQSIQAARSGIHTTISGEYEVSHTTARSYCISVPASKTSWQPDSGRGDGPDEFELDYPMSLHARQLLADQKHSPRRPTNHG